MDDLILMKKGGKVRQKQKQKQTQVVTVNIGKNTRRRRVAPVATAAPVAKQTTFVSHHHVTIPQFHDPMNNIRFQQPPNQGIAGVAGVAGARGLTGAIGATGATGLTGVAGERGAIGYGIHGINGDRGERGATGAIGPTGPIGYGADGLHGINGERGERGERGADAPPIDFGLLMRQYEEEKLQDREGQKKRNREEAQQERRRKERIAKGIREIDIEDDPLAHHALPAGADPHQPFDLDAFPRRRVVEEDEEDWKHEK